MGLKPVFGDRAVCGEGLAQPFRGEILACGDSEDNDENKRRTPRELLFIGKCLSDGFCYHFRAFCTVIAIDVVSRIFRHNH